MIQVSDSKGLNWNSGNKQEAVEVDDILKIE